MFGQCRRQDSVPAGYLSMRDAMDAHIEAATGGRTPPIDQPSDEQIQEDREQYKSLVHELASAVRDNFLNPWAWNRRTNQFLKLSTEVFSRQHSDLHFSNAQLFFLGLPDRERYLEDWIGLVEEKQFQRWLAERYRFDSRASEAEQKPHELKQVGRPSLIHAVIAKIGELYTSGEYPSVKTIRRELQSATPPIHVSEATIARALKAFKVP
jgi:hypothetical protein